MKKPVNLGSLINSVAIYFPDIINWIPYCKNPDADNNQKNEYEIGYLHVNGI